MLGMHLKFRNPRRSQVAPYLYTLIITYNTGQNELKRFPTGIMGEPIYADVKFSYGLEKHLWPNRLKIYHQSQSLSH